MAKELTQRQQEILEYIRWALKTQGRSPSVQEVQREFGFRSPNAVQTHLRALLKKGAIERQGHGARAVRVLDNGDFEGNGGWPPQEARPRGARPPDAALGPQQLEVGIDVFFNAKHSVAHEFGGEMHAHSWRLRAVMPIRIQDGSASVGLDAVRQLLQEAVGELEGAVLNKIDTFLTLDPTPDRMATWLSAKIRHQLQSAGIQLRSLTLWDQPTQYVTICDHEAQYVA